MFRRIVITLTMLLALPAFANAWFVTASKSGGVAGNRVSPAGQTYVSGFAGTFKNISTIAATGDQVNRVTIDGVAQCNTPATATLNACSNSTFYPVNYVAGKTYRTLVAYFGTAIVPGANITVRPPANSTYRVTSPVNGSLTNITKASNRTIAIIPKSGYSVSFVNISSAGAGSGSSACTTSTSAQFLGAKDVVCNNIQGAIAITGTSGVSQTVTVYAGADRTVGAPGQTITLNGSATYTVGTPTYTWTATGPGAVTFGTAYGSNGATPPAQVALPGNYKTFTANAAGTYTVTLTVSGLTGTGSSVLTDTATIVVANATATAVNQCAVCHRSRNDEVFFAYSASGSVHKANDVTCQTCHDPTDTGHYTLPVPNCTQCHNTPGNTDDMAVPASFTSCQYCHGGANIHGATATAVASTSNDCIGCHAVGFHESVTAGSNAGVRAITGEFNKRSHHVTGRAVNNTDCAVCHLEGKKVGTAIAIDPLFHMTDGKIYLRNGNAGLTGNQTTAAGAGYPWDPADPDHTLMDQFCFSCHNDAGAPTAFAAMSTATGKVAGYTGSALNPFGDTVSNSYDQVSRINVVGVYEQFDTNNSSHHAVRGQKYTTRTLAGNTAVFTAISTANAGYTEPSLKGAFPNYSTQQSKPIIGIKSTIGTMYELSTFTATYTPLDGGVLADDITIHCGDCHTVGQFRASDVSLAAGSFNKAVIGAHGSGNEYMLRNSNGDDTLAKDALVCYLCHRASRYAGGATSSAPRHDGVPAYAWHCNGDEMNSAGLTGNARLRPGEGLLTDAEFQHEVTEGKYAADGGTNIFGIKCANCHNASDGKSFGGIHGNAQNASYQSYSGGKQSSKDPTSVVSRKPYRFMPGLGNFRYNGGDDANQWTIKTVSSANKQSCYTLNGASTAATATLPNPPNSSRTYSTASDADKRSPLALAGDNGILGSWGACSDHAGTSISGGAHDPARDVLRPLTY